MSTETERSLRFACAGLVVTGIAISLWVAFGTLGMVLAGGANAAVLSWVARSGGER